MIRRSMVTVLALTTLLAVVPASPPAAAQAVCSFPGNASVGFTPLSDLGTGTYQGEQGGLYPGGSNAAPAGHLARGGEAAAAIQPLDGAGQPSAGGKVVLISIGISNTNQEFDTFMTEAGALADLDSDLVLVNGAQGGKPISEWLDPNAETWGVAGGRLNDAGVTAQQVQVAWVKLAQLAPSGAFPSDAEQFRDDLAQVARNLRTNYPNIQIAYFSSRIFGGYSTLNPEPFAYQTGFGVKWAIEDQINGVGNLNSDPAAGPVMAPWMAWGAYLWADGVNPRSDGLTWLCEDFADGNHPSESGKEKVSALLIDAFRTDPTSCPWFLEAGAACEALPPPSPSGFVDIAGSTFQADIEWLAEQGNTNGCNPPANDRFCPNDLVTRGQMAAFLVRALGYTAGAGSDLFVDDDGNTFDTDIDRLATAGVTLGCNPPTNDRYCPNDPVTRAQMASFLVRALGYTAGAGSDLFVDDDGNTHELDIDRLGTAGVTKGCNPPTNDRYCPGDSVTRGQMAAFLHRALG